MTNRLFLFTLILFSQYLSIFNGRFTEYFVNNEIIVFTEIQTYKHDIRPWNITKLVNEWF